MKNTNNIIILVMTLFCLTSCFPAIFTAATATTIEGAKDRSFNETIDDFKISNQIRNKFISNGFKNLYSRITFKVVQGRVLLTGKLMSNDDVKKAVELVWEIDSVQEVINELKMDPKSSDFSASRYTIDSWITIRIKKSLFFDRSIKFINYTVVTYDSIVYLFGIARSENELLKVTDIASTISGVNKVVSYVKIKEFQNTSSPSNNSKNADSSKINNSFD